MAAYIVFNMPIQIAGGVGWFLPFGKYLRVQSVGRSEGNL